MDSQNNKIEFAENGVLKDELNSVKKLFKSLLLTLKNLSLYPQGHATSINSIKKFYTQLTAFLKKYETLKFEIEKDKIIYKGEIISDEIPEEESLHFTLFRDGIHWIEFMDGIEQEEINAILLIINKYTKLSAEPEGDIVTALWEINIPHMRYEVVEFFWGGNLEKLKSYELISGKSKFIEAPEPEMKEKSYEEDPEIDLEEIKLEPAEVTALQKMICIDEDVDLTSYLDVLLDSLLQQREDANFGIILDALFEEFTLSLTRKDFIVTLKILQSLQYVLDICRNELPWTVKLIEKFLLNASSPKSLEPLKKNWQQIDPGDAEVLRDVFMLLNPTTIQMLISLLSQSNHAPLRKMLLDLIILRASQDTPTLELALKNANESLLERLVSVIVSMDDEQPIKYLLKLSRHPSGRIRYKAVKGILKLDPARVNDMLTLIDDKEESIRIFVMERMEQSRDKAIEEFLISYIKKNKSSKIDLNHIIQCFRVLGKCGSSHSVPFLAETLLKWGFLPGSRRAILRRGAAIALCMLGITQADKVLERASRSLFPGVKRIVNNIRQEMKEEADSSVK